MLERDEVISHAANLKDCQGDAGVWLEIPDHLQSDFKVLIQYGNEARKHYGGEVRWSVRFFEEELGLILHLGLPSGQWLRVTPHEAREMGKFRRIRATDAMKMTLSSSQSPDASLLQEAAAKAFFPVSSPLTGANALPLTSTPVRPGASPVGGTIVEEDIAMNESPGPSGTSKDF